MVFGPVVVLTYVVSVVLGVISNPVSWLTVVVVSFFASLGLAVGVGRCCPARHHAPAVTRSRRRRAVPRRGASRPSCRSSGPMLLTLPAVVVAVLTAGPGAGAVGGAGGGTAYGPGLLAVGVALGGARIDRRAPELLGQPATAQI